MITLKSQREIEQMERSSKILADIHIGLRELIKPGIDMWEIEEYVRKVCKEKMFYLYKSEWMKEIIIHSLMLLAAV